MNPEKFKGLQDQVSQLQNTYQEILSTVRSLEINHQLFLRKNTPIPPGIACKVAYDMNGVILKTDKLSPTDIPELSIDHISGLRALLNDLPTRGDIKKLSVQPTMLVKTEATSTGTKINYDKNGLVVSHSDLLPEDIPSLPIEKIEHLQELLDYLRSHHDQEEKEVIQHPHINPSTFMKVTVDEHGHVLSGSNLSMNDLPATLLTQVNTLESKIPELATQRSVDYLTELMEKKVDQSPEKVQSGVYTKVIVNQDGLVMRGGSLTTQDLPPITINSIQDLRSELNQRASVSDITALNESIGTILQSLSNIPSMLSLDNNIKRKVDMSTYRELESKVDRIQSTVTSFTSNLPEGDVILSQLDIIMNQLSVLDGRIDVLEEKVKSMM